MKTYTLERDIRPPHLDKPLKNCSRCGEAKTNDFGSFPKVPFRTQRYGPRHTTGDVCNACTSEAKRGAARARGQRRREAEELMLRDAVEGKYLK